MNRKIIFHGEHFLDFYKKLDEKTKIKVQYVLELIKQIEQVPIKFLKPIAGCEGLFEIRVEFQSNIYRIFCCFDEGRLVILFNGFQKKSQKIPKEEIERAMKLKEEYFNQKLK